jgi:uncharacterized protein (DUF433 family)
MNQPQSPLIIEDPDILGGLPVFYGTRVPVKTLVDYLTTGETIDEFLDDFPSVTRDQVVHFIEYAGSLAIAENHADTD